MLICPASLKINWQREAELWLVDNLKISIVDKDIDLIADFLIINYDIVDKFFDELIKIDFDVLILDESHYIKNKKAKRTKAILKLCKKIERKIFLTGTPILNKPIDIWTTVNTLDKENFSNWVEFVKRYCGAYQDRFGWKVNGATNLEELQKKLRSTIMIRRLKKDVLTSLPPKTRQIIEIEPKTSSEKKTVANEVNFFESAKEKVRSLKSEISKLSKNSQKYELAVENLKQTENFCFGEIPKLRHETAGKKIPYIIDYLSGVLETKGKIVVFAHHKEVINQIHDKFKSISVKLTGDTNMNDRQLAVDKFQKDKNTKIFIGNIKAAGVGLTLTASDFVIFAELDWTPANVSQAEDRCHRIGQKNNVLIQHILFKDSLDTKIAKTILEKQKIIDKTINI